MRKVAIRVKGQIDARWSDWFDGLTLNHIAAADETVLCGLVPDQAALYGLLAKLRDIGLALVSVDSEEVGEHGTPG
jgi:hypothetical protein